MGLGYLTMLKPCNLFCYHYFQPSFIVTVIGNVTTLHIAKRVNICHQQDNFPPQNVAENFKTHFTLKIIAEKRTL